MSNIAIEFDSIGKMYRLGRVGTGTLSHDLNRWWQTSVLGNEDPYLKIGQTNDRTTKGVSDYVWALRDISFKVEQGDVVGIIGKNGAGKSTLLKLLSNITSPTIGNIKYRGRIASLLEVGTGFHPEMTGRENIFMNGSIMGMSKHEISRKLDEIVDFAGVERYLDTPVKRYSSGMTVRLGFAVAAFLEPEILVVDEVLTVGDAEFQKKAIGKMNDVAKGEGRTVLFVSHNMNAVKSLCNSGVVLKNGMISYCGNCEDAVNFYIGNSINNIVSHSKINNSFRDDHDLLQHGIEYKEAWLLNEDPTGISSDEDLLFRALVHRNDNSIKKVKFNIIISNQLDQRVIFCVPRYSILEDGIDDFIVNTRVSSHGLPRGKYSVRFEASLQSFTNRTQGYDWVNNVLSFEVKYVHRELKDEYLNWNSFNGLIVPNEQFINVSITNEKTLYSSKD